MEDQPMRKQNSKALLGSANEKAEFQGVTVE